MAFAIKNGWAGIARFGGVGDNLIAASPAYALHKKGLKVEVITGEPNHSVFENNPYIDKISAKSKREFSDNMHEWQKWFAGRADEFDVFAHLSHSCEHALAFFPDQTAFWWPAHVRRRLANRNYLEFVHDIAGVPYEFDRLFWPTKEEEEKAEETRNQLYKKGGIRPIIGWAISGTRLDKIHPHLPGMVARVIKELNCHVALLGAPGKNASDSQLIVEHVMRTNGSDEGVHQAISTTTPGNWPIRRSLSFAQSCDLVVTPDTGVAWSVAFEPVPKVVLLSHASPENITKHWKNTVALTADQGRVPCWPCHQLHNSPDTCVSNKENNGAACITDISVDTVVSQIKRQLEVSRGTGITGPSGFITAAEGLAAQQGR